MDTATQALLGAVVGQAGFSHKLGRRAMVFGALGGLVPDLDVVAMATHGPFAEFTYHRGFTHSLWFGPVFGPILGWAIWRFYRWRKQTGPGQPGARSLLGAWVGLMIWALLTHPLIDIFTPYGTQLFAPFWRYRVAINAVGIIDLGYSGILLVGLLAGLIGWGRIGRVRTAAWLALILSWSYMAYGGWLNAQAEQTLQADFEKRGHPEAIVRTYPTFFLPYLRRAVVRTDSEIWVGLYTPMGGGADHWESFPRPPDHPMIERLRSTPEGRLFEWFALEQTVARVLPAPNGVAVEIDDLRYGLPGRPDRGLWGIRGVFNSEGKLTGPVRRIRMQGRPGLDFESFWRATWGEPAALFEVRGGVE